MVDVLVSAFSQGLREGDFFRFLIKKSPFDYDDLPGKVEKYINVKEAQNAKQIERSNAVSRGEPCMF